MTDVMIPPPSYPNHPENTNTNTDNAAEEEDAFGGSENGERPVFDLSMLSGGGDTSSSSRQRGRGPGARGTSASVAPTIASDMGSVMMDARDAFLKSFTFEKPKEGAEDINWGLSFNNVVTTGKAFQKKTRLPIGSVDDFSIFSLSRISHGDYLKTINGRSIGPSMNGSRALAKMKSVLETDGYLQITTKNREEGTDDILVHATVLKPSEGLTLEDLGMKVWVWGFLCIKSIKRDSIFRHSALKEADNIISINEILCEKLEPEQFADIVKRLPKEITITVLRRKQRATGKFG